jgi:Reverse transcriptase (RNA-dependent DNA polymerase)
VVGAFFLNALDQAVAKLGLFYIRFMDDILVLAPSRWRLRRAVRLVNQTLGMLNLKKHPDKTFIGRIERGFDFLGYHFSPAGLSVAKKTIDNFIEKAFRLYEQRRRTAVSAVSPLEMYVRRWLRWTKSGQCVCERCGLGALKERLPLAAASLKSLQALFKRHSMQALSCGDRRESQFPRNRGSSSPTWKARAPRPLA